MQTGKTSKTVIAACVRLLALIGAFGLMPAIAMAAEFSGLVVGISDGDTIKVLDETHYVHTVRLMGIDAPEKAQAWGQRSKQSLANLIFERQVSVQWFKRDKYGRTVGKVLAQDGADVCLEQITRGMAWHYKKYAGEQPADDRDQYADAEKVAQESGVGLWQDESPVPPWVWRHSKAK